MTPDEYSELLRAAAYDAAGDPRSTPRAADELLRSLDDAEQAHRDWAPYHRERLLRMGAAQEIASYIALHMRIEYTNGGATTSRSRVRRVRREEQREDGTVFVYYQPTLWDHMTRAELIQMQARELQAAEQRNENAKLAGLLIDLCDRHNALNVPDALAAEGVDTVEEWLAAAA